MPNPELYLQAGVYAQTLAKPKYNLKPYTARRGCIPKPVIAEGK